VGVLNDLIRRLDLLSGLLEICPAVLITTASYDTSKARRIIGLDYHRVLLRRNLAGSLVHELLLLLLFCLNAVALSTFVIASHVD
jgi:hypothetical protein